MTPIEVLVATLVRVRVGLAGIVLAVRVTEATLETRGNSLQLAQRQFETGYSSRLEWMQAASEFQTAKAQVPQLRHQIAQQENALSILVGMNPREIARRRPETVPGECLALDLCISHSCILPHPALLPPAGRLSGSGPAGA